MPAKLTSKYNFWARGKICISISYPALHNEELNGLHSASNIIQVIKSRKMGWVGHLVRMREKRGAYRILVGRPEVRRPLRRPRHTWEDYIKMDLQDAGSGHGLD
jgi:hypothetical protein